MNAMYNLSKLGGFAQIMYLVAVSGGFLDSLLIPMTVQIVASDKDFMSGRSNTFGKPSTKQAPIVWTLPTLTYRHFKCLICAAERTL